MKNPLALKEKKSFLLISSEQIYSKFVIISLLAFRRTSFSNVVSDNFDRLGDKVIPPNEKRRSTGAEEGRVVLNFKNIVLISG